MSRLTAAWASVILAGVSAPALAHHSFPATYIVDKQITIKGTVVQFLCRNPHSFVHVLAPDKDGKMLTWAVEWGAGGALGSDNIKQDTIKPGDVVIVTGNPARDQDTHRLRMRSIERPSDGFKWAGTFG
jgi:Family of unknown function (DUF6152)